MVNENLQKLKSIIESWDCEVLPKEYGPYTVSLMNEQDPTGWVEFKDKDGIPRLQLPREDYESIKEHEVHMTRQVLKFPTESINVLTNLSLHVYKVSEISGFHAADKYLADGTLANGRFGEYCANLHGEVSELWEAYRKGNLYNKCDKPIDLSCAAEELADIVIRALDAAVAMKINIGEAIAAKDAYNQTRSYMHGKKA